MFQLANFIFNLAYFKFQILQGRTSLLLWKGQGTILSNILKHEKSFFYELDISLSLEEPLMVAKILRLIDLQNLNFSIDLAQTFTMSIQFLIHKRKISNFP